MDESVLERAKENEMAERHNSIQDVLARTDHGPGEEQITINGKIVCIDCMDEIPEARLKIKPDAVRCVECKEHWEKRHGY